MAESGPIRERFRATTLRTLSASCKKCGYWHERTVKGSNRRRKKTKWLAKAWPRIQKREHEYRHELAAALVKPPSTRFFAEDIKITNMVKSGPLARAIHESQWGSLVHLLTGTPEHADGGGEWPRGICRTRVLGVVRRLTPD